MAVLHSFTPLPPPYQFLQHFVGFSWTIHYVAPNNIGGGGGRGKVRVSRLLESRYDVYLLSPTAKIDKKKVRWADESRQQAASEGNDKVNNNVCEPQKKTISNFLFLLCCLVVCFFYFTVLINWRAQHPGLKLFLCFLVSSVPVRTEISEVRIEPRTLPTATTTTITSFPFLNCC